ncbi:MAG: type IV pilin protein [Sedimenticola sp.]|nr:type IV pilin protein [Sedimenticola sp.]
MKKGASTGFTLIELMIVVAVIGILAAIAYPSYLEQVQKTRRSNCAGELVGLGNAMERFFTVNGTYVGATVGGAAGDIYPAQCPIDGGTAYYNLSITAQTGSTFAIQATPTGAQAGDSCGTLSYTNTGQKAATGGSLAECWK